MLCPVGAAGSATRRALDESVRTLDVNDPFEAGQERQLPDLKLDGQEPGLVDDGCHETPELAHLASERVEIPSGCHLHERIHKAVPQARCLLHTHMRYATVLTCLKDSNLLPIDQNTMRFYGKVAVDEAFEGMAMEADEGDRLAGVLGDKTILLMGNHGVVVAGPTVAKAVDDLYYFEKACEVLVTAYATGKELRVVSDAVARQTMADWESYPDMAERHFAELRAMLDTLEPDYKS